MPTRTIIHVAYESLASESERVQTKTDAEGKVTSHVLKSARLLGLVSRNERTYLMPKASMYEGVKVNLDHPTWNKDTSVNDSIGFIENAKAVEGKGIFGDVVLNPSHPRTEQHVWNAENAPGNLGFSHVALTERADVDESSDGDPVLRVVEVISVDLVGRPATTNGMFEQENDPVELKEALARIEALATENTKLVADVGVAEQNLQTEKDAHEATKNEHVEAAKTAEREALLNEIEGEIAPAFRKAVESAETVEDAKALIESITPAKNTPKSKSQEEKSSEGDEKPQTYEQLAEAGKLDYTKEG